MTLRVTKWGNSFGVRLPAAWVKKIGLGAGDQLRAKLKGDALTLEPLKQLPHYTLDELLARLNSRNIHAEISTGPDVGREAIE